ncbi:MAG: hypothetical protein ACREJX_19005, partial [Polyangiaceae bacterium]
MASGAFVAFAFFCACSGSSPSGFETGDGGQLGAVGDGGSQGSLPSGGGADGGGTPGKTLFYVHTNTTLY